MKTQYKTITFEKMKDARKLVKALHDYNDKYGFSYVMTYRPREDKKRVEFYNL